MTELVVMLLVFVATGFGFLFVNLIVGRVLRPNVPGDDKGAVYECGEPAVGSSWIQFDLRFYVVALLFVIFDVEMAFFFPWATVFGTANQLAEETDPQRRAVLVARLEGGPASNDNELRPAPSEAELDAAKTMAKIAFVDLLIFFGVLLVGFAYLWKRGDLDWVRSTAGQEPKPAGA
jgi:NADH-quinone oxidoreductase subunit A